MGTVGTTKSSGHHHLLPIDSQSQLARLNLNSQEPEEDQRQFPLKIRAVGRHLSEIRNNQMGNLCSVSIDAARCWDCAAGRANYAISLAENLATLKVEVEELKEMRNDVVRRVTVAERQNLQRLDQVQGWLSRAETEIVGIEKMIDDSPLEDQKLCLGVSCTRNPLSGYQLGKDVVKKLQRVGDLKSKGAFTVVANRALAAVVKERPSEPTIGSEQTFAALVRSFADESVSTIGIHGMGGIGKTTLLTRLNNKLLQEAHHYNIVIWITVSRGGDVEMIQEEMAKRLYLYNEPWERKRVDEKAMDIYEALGRMKFVLLLDDVWERINLRRVGVPIPSPEYGSKILFTCRSQEVCLHMEPQRIIKVECLPLCYAWDLFEGKVGSAIGAHQYIPVYARKMVRECRGLPLALVTVGQAMASKKTVQEWRHASELLSKCASDFSGMGDVVFPLLKFSYDALPSDRDRSCFLYCALFPGSIKKIRLIDYWIGEGYLDIRNGVSRLQDQGYDVIGSLINASILQDEEESVVMHDMIRDMAIWIACDYGHNHNVLVRASAHLTEIPEISKWECVKRMSLSANRIWTLEEAPRSSNLQTLILDHNCLKVISEDFFQHLATLTVLDLSYNRNLKELPLGISKLVLLQHLNLSMTGIMQLPNELKALSMMKCLNLDCTPALVKIAKNVISSFSQLQVLRMAECGTETEVVELQYLKTLSLLSITIRSVVAIQIFLDFCDKFHSCTQELSILDLGSSKSLDIKPLMHMENLEVVHVKNCSNLEVLQMGEGSTTFREQLYRYRRRDSEIMNTISLCNLQEIVINNCPELRDLTCFAFAQNLRVLDVSLCFKMEQIIVAERLDPGIKEAQVLFPRMEVLYLSHLLQLKSVNDRPGALFHPTSAAALIRGCPMLMTPASNSSRKGLRSEGGQSGRHHPSQDGLSAP